MKENYFKILSIELFPEYLSKVDPDLLALFQKLNDSPLSLDTFNFYTSVSAVYSSKIEGEDIQLDSFIKHKRFDAKFLPDYTQKIDDLYDAYIFAQKNTINSSTVKAVHALLTQHILQKQQQGKLRSTNMFVVTDDGKIEYVAVSPDKLELEWERLLMDIDQLLNEQLTFAEVLFFASLIHLAFVKIHPFQDGNGRTARLLEKWFVAIKAGESAWFMQSERYYYQQHQVYYKNIRLLGVEYDLLDYTKALPFLLMLPQSLNGIYPDAAS